MKSTGVIRRIDELGRIVLPKEIRRNLSIREGENLEIFVEEERIVLKKFSKIEDYQEIVKNICNLVLNVYEINMIVTDRDKVVYANKFSSYIGTELDGKFINYIHNRESVLKNEMQTYNFNGEEKSGYYFIQPIISSTDCLGLILIFSLNPLMQEHIHLLKFLANLLVSKIDIA